jgi:hypothetical protein
MGSSDPFCTTESDSDGGGTSVSCQTCGSTLKPAPGGGWTTIATCDPVPVGEVGATECEITLLFSTCKLSGRACTVINVNP